MSHFGYILAAFHAIQSLTKVKTVTIAIKRHRKWTPWHNTVVGDRRSRLENSSDLANYYYTVIFYSL